MKVSAREDIEAPAQKVFAYLIDYPAHEALAAGRGVLVERLARPNAPPDRPAWKAEFQYGGRSRDVTIIISEVREPDRIVSDVQYQGLDAKVDVELVPLARNRTRIITGIELVPRSLKARLVVQSLKLAKGSITRRLSGRMKTLAREIERKHRADGS